MNERDERFVPLGKHSILVDNDSVMIIARGAVTIEEMRDMLGLFDRIKREHERLFVLYDARQSAGIEASARRLATDQPRSNREADLQVFFGMPFAVRVILNMIIRAQKVLQDRIVKLHVFATEAEARTFFNAEREKIRQEKRIKTSV